MLVGSYHLTEPVCLQLAPATYFLLRHESHIDLIIQLSERGRLSVSTKMSKKNSYVISHPKKSAFSHVSPPLHITLGSLEFKIQLNRLSFSLDREREQKVLPPLTKNSWNQNLEISLNQITTLQNQIPGLCYRAKNLPSYERWARLIMIRHATHTQNHFSLVETWHFNPNNIPTRSVLFSNL